MKNMEGEIVAVKDENVIVKDENVVVKDENVTVSTESAESKNESDSQLPALSVYKEKDKTLCDFCGKGYAKTGIARHRKKCPSNTANNESEITKADPTELGLQCGRGVPASCIKKQKNQAQPQPLAVVAKGKHLIFQLYQLT